MNAKLYCTIAAVIATGAIGMMYTIPSAEASTDHGYSIFGNERGYDNESKIYDEYGKDFTTEQWIKHLSGTGRGDNGFRQPICFLISPSENPNDDCYWTDQIVYGKRHLCWNINFWDNRDEFTEEATDMIRWYCEKYASLAFRTSFNDVRDILTSKLELENRVTELEVDVGEKNTRITGLESKVSELVLIEKAHQELTETFDQKNNTIENQETTIADLQTAITDLRDKVDKKNNIIDNKNNRIDNLREERNQLQNLADKRLDRIHNLKDKQDVTNTSVQDLIDMLQADPNTSTADILEALKKLLQ